MRPNDRLAIFSDDTAQPGHFIWHSANDGPHVPGAPLTFLTADAKADHAVSRLLERAIARGRRLGDYFVHRIDYDGVGVLSLASAAPGDIGPDMLTSMQIGPAGDYVAIRGSQGLGAGNIGQVANVTIVTGLCLFSNRLVWARATADGPRIPLGTILSRQGLPAGPLAAIGADPELSLYELETSARLSRTIAGLLTALPAGLAVEIDLQVPRVQYYLYLLAALRAGTIGRTAAEQWFDAVDARSAVIVALFTSQLAKFSARMRVTCPPIRVCAGWDRWADRIRTESPDLPEILGWLIAAEPIWERVVAKHRPRTLRDVANLSYPIEFATLHRERGGIIVAVDSPAEQRIFDTFRRLPGVRRAGPALGLFPMERAIMIREGRLSSTYYSDPGQRLVDENGTPYAPSELVSCLYDELPASPPARIAESVG